MARACISGVDSYIYLAGRHASMRYGLMAALSWTTTDYISGQSQQQKRLTVRNSQSQHQIPVSSINAVSSTMRDLLRLYAETTKLAWALSL